MPPTPLSAPQKALRKLGLVRDIDLALHLPLRYEDETRIVRLRDAREGDTVQIEAAVTACEVTMRPRRQLLVTVDDGIRHLHAAVFQLLPVPAEGAGGGQARPRAGRGARWLSWGWTMMHPGFQPAGGELPVSADAGLPHRGRLAAGLPAPRGGRRAGAGRPVGDPARRY